MAMRLFGTLGVAFLATSGLSLPRCGDPNWKQNKVPESGNAAYRFCYLVEEDSLALDALMRRWEKDVRIRVISKDKKLSAWAAKHPLVILHSSALYREGLSPRCSYNFVDQNHVGNVHVLFHNGVAPKEMEPWNALGRQSVVADLGAVDFAVDPDPAKISIDGPGVFTAGFILVERHVYLLRVLDDRGNDFCVLFCVVLVDDESRFAAFLWRRLPGGRIVKTKR